MKVIGVVGTFCAGATSIAKKLGELLDAPVGSLAEKLREELRRRGVPVVRENLQKLANELRSKDSRALGWLVIEEFEGLGKNVFIAEPIRSMGDYLAFKQKYGNDFVLLGVDAPIKVRYERALGRKREGEEKLLLEEFKASEEKEARKEAREFEQNIPRVSGLADYVIVNDGTLGELDEKLKRFLREYGLLRE